MEAMLDEVECFLFMRRIIGERCVSRFETLYPDPVAWVLLDGNVEGGEEASETGLQVRERREAASLLASAM